MTTTLAQMDETMYDNSYYTTTYDDSYYTTTYTDYSFWAAMAGFMTFFWVIILLSYVVTAIFLGMIFKKAGEPAWKAWVPIYNTWTLLQLGGQNGIWAVLALIPVVNIVAAVFMYIAMYHVGKNLGKPDAFVLLAIFLPIVWLIWLAVDSSTWKGAKPSRSSK